MCCQRSATARLGSPQEATSDEKRHPEARPAATAAACVRRHHHRTDRDHRQHPHHHPSPWVLPLLLRCLVVVVMTTTMVMMMTAADEDLSCHEEADWGKDGMLLHDDDEGNDDMTASPSSFGDDDDDDLLTCNEEVEEWFCSSSASSPSSSSSAAPPLPPSAFRPLRHHHHHHQQLGVMTTAVVPSRVSALPLPGGGGRLPKAALVLRRSLSDGVACSNNHNLHSNRSFSSVGELYRQSTRHFLSQNLPSVSQVFPDVAEMLGIMARQGEEQYRVGHDYIQRLLVPVEEEGGEKMTALGGWRKGSVKWFAKVVERFEGNREIIATAVNFLDRYYQSRLGDTSSEHDSHLISKDRQSYEHAVACSLILAWKMHQGDTIITPKDLAQFCTSPPSLKALYQLEFDMIAALRRHLNPPTAGTFIHHLLSVYLPRTDRPLLFLLDDHANDLALLALESPEFLSLPVLAVSVACILAAMARLQADGVSSSAISSDLEQRWLEALETRGIMAVGEASSPDGPISRGLALLKAMTSGVDDVQMDEVEFLTCCATPTNAYYTATHHHSNGSWGGHSQFADLYLPDYLLKHHHHHHHHDKVGGLVARSVSPSGVDEIVMMEEEGQGAAKGGGTMMLMMPPAGGGRFRLGGGGAARPGSSTTSAFAPYQPQQQAATSLLRPFPLFGAPPQPQC